MHTVLVFICVREVISEAQQAEREIRIVRRSLVRTVFAANVRSFGVFNDSFDCCGDGATTTLCVLLVVCDVSCSTVNRLSLTHRAGSLSPARSFANRQQLSALWPAGELALFSCPPLSEQESNSAWISTTSLCSNWRLLRSMRRRQITQVGLTRIGKGHYNMKWCVVVTSACRVRVLQKEPFGFKTRFLAHAAETQQFHGFLYAFGEVQRAYTIHSAGVNRSEPHVRPGDGTAVCSQCDCCERNSTQHRQRWHHHRCCRHTRQLEVAKRTEDQVGWAGESG